MQKILTVQVPLTEFPAIRVTVEHPDGTIQRGTMLGHPKMTQPYGFTLPEGVEPEHCRVFAELCSNGSRVCEAAKPILIQEPEPEPKPEPKPEPIVPEPEPIVPEPEPEVRVDSVLSSASDMEHRVD